MNTTFRRQLTLMLCILLAATILLGLAFWVVFDRYAARKQETSLQSTADTVASLTQFYSSPASMYLDWDFRLNLSAASGASENDVLLCTTDGQVFLCAQDVQDCEHIGRTLGASAVEKITKQGSASIDDAATLLYGEKRLAVASAAYSSDGTFMCIVVASMKRADLSALTGGTLRLFILTALAVFLVALLAMPYLTRRETKPIKDMAAAARQLAHGNLSVRVPTGYQNEEMEELAVAFNNMAASVQNSETIRQEFVANVSHELKTPMTTIAGYLDGILDGTIPPEKHRVYMELVSTEVRRLSRLVRNMLDVARLKDQGIPPDKLTDFDICEEASQALLSFEQRINQKHLNVDIDMPEFGLTVHAFADAVSQVIYNLLDNAVKFIDDGGTLSIHARQQGGKAVVSIANTGPTIDPAELPLIFDRFHKTDKSRSTDRDGVGLGLYIVKTIVLAHGEDIYVTSRDGKTEFTFTMPLKK
jgi:signal transduction histidine kinase